MSRIIFDQNTGECLRSVGQNAALSKLLKKGVSIRQASRITGVSVGIVRKYTAKE